jgi:hypothetical protein
MTLFILRFIRLFQLVCVHPPPLFASNGQYFKKESKALLRSRVLVLFIKMMKLVTVVYLLVVTCQIYIKNQYLVYKTNFIGPKYISCSF